MNKAYKSNFFDIESKQKRLKMLNSDRKENKTIRNKKNLCINKTNFLLIKNK